MAKKNTEEFKYSTVLIYFIRIDNMTKLFTVKIFNYSDSMINKTFSNCFYQSFPFTCWFITSLIISFLSSQSFLSMSVYHLNIEMSSDSFV